MSDSEQTIGLSPDGTSNMDHNPPLRGIGPQADRTRPLDDDGTIGCITFHLTEHSVKKQP